MRAFAVALCLASAIFTQGCSSGSSGGGGTTTSSTLTVVSNSLPAGTVGLAYAANVFATGGSGTGYVWAVASGTLPAGISLSSSGTLSGTPTVAGTANVTVKVTDSAGNSATSALSIVVSAGSPLANYDLTGDTSPTPDPSIIRQGSTYYVFVTDSGNQTGYIPIRCSTDKIAWKSCGYVFSTMPSWTASQVPAATGIWAPDISFFNGTYHLYYAVSSFGSQVSAIGLATTPTLDSTDPSYKWTDQGAILTSSVGSDFNAIDPSILVDTDGSVWMTYGSFWNGIFEQQVDASTGQVMPGTRYHLAQRAATVANDPVEGSSLVHKGNYYYLFVSWDSCCNSNPATDNYKIVVGRGTSPQGPFLDQTGVDMVAGGGTILLQGDGVNWIAPGGQTAYIDPTGGDLIVFHALNANHSYADYLFVRTLSWTNDWPVIGNSAQ